MKNVLLVCLLAVGVTAAKAQCPINDILATRDLQTIATMIDNNTDCIKTALASNPEYSEFKTYLDYIYNSSAPWIYHTNPDKEKLFADFYAKWGKLYPNLHSDLPMNGEFYKAMKEMVATDPAYFAQTKHTLVASKYKEWMYVQDLKAKYGEMTVVHAENAAAKIANLQATNNLAFIK